MSVSVLVEYKLRTMQARARFTKKVWYSAIRESVMRTAFGDKGIKMIRPAEVIAKNERIVVDHYAILNVTLKNFRFQEKFFVSDKLVDLVDNEADLIVGSEAISKNHIRVFEENDS